MFSQEAAKSLSCDQSDIEESNIAGCCGLTNQAAMITIRDRAELP
jgi:hypothetical protein